ncbi:MAG: glycosyltransferase family 1 protein [Lachnospiraceae bacterium]
MEDKCNNPMRVLHITEMLSAAGIESFIMNMYRRIDKSCVQFDFLVLRDEHEFYDDEIKELGGIKYWVHSNISNTLFRILDETQQIEQFLKEHRYDVVHIHYTTPLRAPYLKACLKANVKKRIYHSHSAYVSGKNFIKHAVYGYMKKQISKYATDYFACSMAAAEWIFEKKLIDDGTVKIIYNGIDTKKFAYSVSDRKAVRKELDINDEFVLVHTGRFMSQKNHRFVVDVFYELKKICTDSKLLLLGTGELFEEVKHQVNELGLADDVIFAGVRSDVNRFLSAADCYIMPSLYEGLPVSAIEAECAGLPCIFSENITREVSLIEGIEFLSLDETVHEWVKQILKFKDVERYDKSEIVKNSGYDIQAVAKKMQQLYMES